jgi:hypothetical protein
MASASRPLLLVLLLAAAASARLHEELSTLNQQARKSELKAPFKACIDDSDCKAKGAGYACFQYICYPWADDTGIAARDKYVFSPSYFLCPLRSLRSLCTGVSSERPRNASSRPGPPCLDGIEAEGVGVVLYRILRMTIWTDRTS